MVTSTWLVPRFLRPPAGVGVCVVVVVVAVVVGVVAVVVVVGTSVGAQASTKKLLENSSTDLRLPYQCSGDDAEKNK